MLWIFSIAPMKNYNLVLGIDIFCGVIVIVNLEPNVLMIMEEASPCMVLFLREKHVRVIGVAQSHRTCDKDE